MEPNVIILSILGILLLFLLLASGLEIAASLGIFSIIGLVVALDQSPFIVARMTWGVAYNHVLTAIPLFVFMGEIFLRSGISERLFNGLQKWVGRLPGGLASTIVVACTIFSAISGSSPATAATVGAISIPEMKKNGYDTKLAYGVVAAGGTLGILIPPSITMIVYGAFVGISVVDLFKAGIIPGMLLAAAFIAMIMIRAKLNPAIAPRSEVSATWSEKLHAIRDIAPLFLIIGAVLGGIMMGITTPTEGAAVGVVFSIVFSFLYKKLTWKVIKESALDSVKMTSMILFVIFGANALAYIVQSMKIPEIIATPILALDVSKYTIIFFICALYFVLGCFLDVLSMLLVTIPLIVPIIPKLGYDLTWFGIVFVICTEAGMITPPVGLNLFVIQGIDKDATLVDIMLGSIPFLAIITIMIAIIVLFPDIVLWLPSVS
jgi:tripartite ATP-independent transporter DctM subunit